MQQKPCLLVRVIRDFAPAGNRDQEAVRQRLELHGFLYIGMGLDAEMQFCLRPGVYTNPQATIEKYNGAIRLLEPGYHGREMVAKFL